MQTVNLLLFVFFQVFCGHEDVNPIESSMHPGNEEAVVSTSNGRN
jgi:hypothetical protein